jgi:hypothetical protein
MEEFWSERGCDLSASYKLLLSVVMKEAAAEKADLLVRCRSDQIDLQRELDCRGFSRSSQAVLQERSTRFKRECSSEYAERNSK